MFSLAFDPVGTVLPVLRGAALDPLGQVSGIQREEESLRLVDAGVATPEEQSDLVLSDLVNRGVVAARPALAQEMMAGWAGLDQVDLSPFAADLLAAPFGTSDTGSQPVDVNAGDAPQRDRGAGLGGRFLSPSDVGQGVQASAVEPAAVDTEANLLNVALNTINVNQEVTLTGRLQVLTAVTEDGHLPDQYELEVDGESIPLLLDGSLREYHTGDTLTIRGERTAEGLLTSRDAITLVEKAPDQDESSGMTDPGVTGTSVRTILVININFSDRVQQPWTIASVENLFEGAIASWYYDGSYGQMTTSTDPAGWFTIPSTSATCASGTWNTQAQAAATAAGYNPASYNHIVIAFPRVPACNWSGLGQVPGRITWLNNAMNHGVAVHELGHNLGLLHSHSRRCTVNPLQGSCTDTEYGDRFDVMGNAGGRAHYHASYRSYVGWIPAADRALVTPNMGAVVVDIYSAASPFGTRIIQVRRGGGQTNSLYIEWREAFGYDSVLSSYPVLLNGVAIYLAANNNFRDQTVIDINYQTSTANDAALQLGEVFYDYAGDLVIYPFQRVDGYTSVYIGYGL